MQLHIGATHQLAEMHAQPYMQAHAGAVRLGHDILVVDDDHAIAQFVSEVLFEEGFKVRVAHDGGSALLEILRNPPGMLFLDVAMPVMVGDELLRHLRSHGYTALPVVIMTAGLHPETYMSAGASAVMPKPFTVDRLLDLATQFMPQA